jgi:hypothetical protein
MTELFFNESTSLGASGVSITDDFDILKYIDINDPYNSFIFYILSNLSTIDYTITKYAGRVDLISEEIFKNPFYFPILIFINPYSKFELKEVIKVIDKNQLRLVFQNIQIENEKSVSFNDDI